MPPVNFKIFEPHMRNNPPKADGTTYLRFEDDGHIISVIAVDIYGGRIVAPYLIGIDKNSGQYILFTGVNVTLGLNLDRVGKIVHGTDR